MQIQFKIQARKQQAKKTPAKWICPNCGEQNNEKAQNCINCFTKKP